MTPIHLAVYNTTQGKYALHVDGATYDMWFDTMAELRTGMELDADAPIVVIDHTGKYLYTSRMVEGLETTTMEATPIS